MKKNKKKLKKVLTFGCFDGIIVIIFNNYYYNNFKLSYVFTSKLMEEIFVILITDSVQFSSVAQSRPTLCDPMNHSTPGLPVHHQFPESTQTHIHRVSDAIQPSHPLSSSSPPAPSSSQNQSLFQGVNSSQQVAKILAFQLQHQSFQ